MMGKRFWSLFAVALGGLYFLLPLAGMVDFSMRMKRGEYSFEAYRIVLADPIGSGLADWVETGVVGPDGAYAVEGIGGSEVPANLHREAIDAAERVSDEESFAMARRLIREEGLLVGGSAGTNVAAAVRVAARGDVDGPVVTVLPDGWDRYRSCNWL